MSGTLRIGILPTIAPYIVPDFIFYFKSSFPNVNLFIFEKESNSLLKELRHGNIDIAITTAPSDMIGLWDIPVYLEKFVAYFSSECKKAREIIESGNLPVENMWILKEGHCVPNSLQNFCKNMEAGNSIYEAGSIETLIRIVDRNGGFTIIPELHLNFLSEKQKNNIAYLNMESPAQRVVSLIIKEDFIRERVVNAVVDTFKSVIPSYMIDERIKKKCNPAAV